MWETSPDVDINMSRSGDLSHNVGVNKGGLKGKPKQED